MAHVARCRCDALLPVSLLHRRSALCFPPCPSRRPLLVARCSLVASPRRRLALGMILVSRDRCERFYDDVDEMRAFMSMFMELVDMFGSDVPRMANGCVPGCKGGHPHLPAGELVASVAWALKPSRHASCTRELRCALSCSLFSGPSLQIVGFSIVASAC